ncbi:hypothetical protein KKA14_21795, partial [bacterium]|nr:hypothetical protein [bacterium]
MTTDQIVKKLESKPADKTLFILLVIGLILILVSYLLFRPNFAVLAPSGYSIVDQQTVFTYERNEMVLSAWKAIPGGIKASLMCAMIDLFLFMPAYVLLGLSWGLLVARHAREKASGIGMICALCILPAWAFDIVETGIQTIISLNVDSYSPGLVPVMSTAAVAKFIFFYTCL